jgi:iron-sulfur cluster assembly accessory protein
VFERAGARVVVDESSLQLLLGATVDYEEEMMKSAFVIKDNPIAEASCGCGTSFQVNI